MTAPADWRAMVERVRRAVGDYCSHTGPVLDGDYSCADCERIVQAVLAAYRALTRPDGEGAGDEDARLLRANRGLARQNTQLIKELREIVKIAEGAATYGGPYPDSNAWGQLLAIKSRAQAALPALVQPPTRADDPLVRPGRGPVDSTTTSASSSADAGYFRTPTRAEGQPGGLPPMQTWCEEYHEQPCNHPRCQAGGTA